MPAWGINQFNSCSGCWSWTAGLGIPSTTPIPWQIYQKRQKHSCRVTLLSQAVGCSWHDISLILRKHGDVSRVDLGCLPYGLVLWQIFLKNDHIFLKLFLYVFESAFITGNFAWPWWHVRRWVPADLKAADFTQQCWNSVDIFVDQWCDFILCHVLSFDSFCCIRMLVITGFNRFNFLLLKLQFCLKLYDRLVFLVELFLQPFQLQLIIFEVHRLHQIFNRRLLIEQIL